MSYHPITSIRNSQFGLVVYPNSSQSQRSSHFFQKTAGLSSSLFGCLSQAQKPSAGSLIQPSCQARPVPSSGRSSSSSRGRILWVFWILWIIWIPFGCWILLPSPASAFAFLFVFFPPFAFFRWVSPPVRHLVISFLLLLLFLFNTSTSPIPISSSQ